MEERKFHVLMRELCLEEGIEFEKLSYGWILQLTKKGKVRHIAGNRFDINPEAAGNIACDKYATYEVLKSQNIPVIKHKMVFNPTNRSRYISDEGIWMNVASEFLKYGTLVVKPNYGSEGMGIYLCKTMKEVEAAISKLFKSHGSISICPYYNIKKEYRTFYLNGEVLLIYGKTKPSVKGDGKKTLRELIEENLNMPDKSVARENLNNIDLDYVPSDGEEFDISWKHNLSGGATPEILKEGELYEGVKQLAIEAGKAMNVKFATIDVIQTDDDNLYIMEVNSGVCATIFIDSVDGGYEIIKEIYRKALKELFK